MSEQVSPPQTHRRGTHLTHWDVFLWCLRISPERRGLCASPWTSRLRLDTGRQNLDWRLNSAPSHTSPEFNRQLLIGAEIWVPSLQITRWDWAEFISDMGVWFFQATFPLGNNPSRWLQGIQTRCASLFSYNPFTPACSPIVVFSILHPSHRHIDGCISFHFTAPLWLKAEWVMCLCIAWKC